MSRSLPRGTRAGAVALLGALAAASALEAQRIPFEQRVFSEQVLRPARQPVVPIYEGWFPNADGTRDICFGYFNLNLDEPVDIPLGAGNLIEPPRFDGQQPTHFTPVPGMTPTSPFTSRFRRIWCAFTVRVPADFGEDDRVWWTLARDGEEPVRTPGTINVAYVLDEPTSDGRGNVAPTMRLSAEGEPFQGRSGRVGPARTVRPGEPLELTVRLEHPFEEQLWVGWVKYKGSGEVAFAPAEQRVSLRDGTAVATASATFAETGDYELLVQSINSTAAFEFHCCWTNGYVPVRVVE